MKKDDKKMIYNSNLINLSKLKEIQLDITNEHDYFKKVSLSSFENSYFNLSNDAYVLKYSIALKEIYNEIECSYTEICKYIISYVNDASALEYVLRDASGYGTIKNKTIRTFVSKNITNLPKKEKFNN